MSADKTLTGSISQAGFGRPRARLVPASALVVVLLALLFASAISAALTPHPVPDAAQAAIEGGL